MVSREPVELTPLRKQHNAWLRRRFQGRRFGRVLNLGCGTDEDKEGGRYRDYVDADEVVMADLSPCRPGVLRADAADLPFPDGSFDLVFANWVVYKARLPLALAEIRRVLRPGGEAAISMSGSDADWMEAIHRTAACYVDPVDNWRLNYEVRGMKLRGNALWGVRRPQLVGASPDDADHVAFSGHRLLVVAAHWDDDVLSFGSLLRTVRDATIVVATKKGQDSGQREVFERLWRSQGHRVITLPILQRRRWPYPGESRTAYMQASPRTLLTGELLADGMAEYAINLRDYSAVLTHDDIGTDNYHPQHHELREALRRLVPMGQLWVSNDRCGLLRFDGDTAWKREAVTAYGLDPRRAERADWLTPIVATDEADGVAGGSHHAR